MQHTKHNYDGYASGLGDNHQIPRGQRAKHIQSGEKVHSCNYNTCNQPVFICNDWPYVDAYKYTRPRHVAQYCKFMSEHNTQYLIILPTVISTFYKLYANIYHYFLFYLLHIILPISLLFTRTSLAFYTFYHMTLTQS
jgi:hypothetical protein